MEHPEIEAKVKALVADNKLESAIDLLIEQEQQAQQRKNALLVLKGRLAMLEEQELGGMLSYDELSRQRAILAHQLLDIADGSSLDDDTPRPETAKPAPTSASPLGKYLLLGGAVLAVVLAVFFLKNNNPEPAAPSHEERTEQPRTNDQPTDTEPVKPTAASEVKLLDFPKINAPFNFLDLRYTFREAVVEKYSDGSAGRPPQIKLTLRMDLTCRSNLGICYREEVRVLVDGTPIAPTERKALEGWLEHNASTQEELVFIFDANATQYHLELSRDGSNWKRPFKVIGH